jgi:hypothetical protein
MAWNQGNSVLIIAWDLADFDPSFPAVFRSVAAAACTPGFSLGSETRSISRETA